MAQPEAVGNEEWRSAVVETTEWAATSPAAKSWPSTPASTVRVSPCIAGRAYSPYPNLSRLGRALEAAVGGLRKELRAFREQRFARQKDVAAMGEDREACIAMCEQLPLPITGY